MKKLFALIGISAFLVLSCAGSPGTVFDDSVPVEQTAWLSANVGDITSYNGISVDWKQSAYKLIQIPSGNATLEWNLSSAPSYRFKNGTVSGKNLLFAYNFQPQKKYIFVYNQSDGNKGLNVYVYDFEEKFGGSWDAIDTHFAGFAPFLNVSGGNNKTVLD